MSKELRITAGELYSTIRVEWAEDRFGVHLM